MNNEAKVAYLAGLIDGDGCLSLHRNDSGLLTFKPSLKVKMTNERVIRWLHKEFGGRVSVWTPKEPNREVMYSWQIYKKADLRRLLPELLSFLIVKKLQAALLLEFVESFSNPTRARFSQVDTDKMLQYARVLQILNSTGEGSNAAKLRLERIFTE